MMELLDNSKKKFCAKCRKELDVKNLEVDLAIVKGNLFCMDCFLQLEKEAGGINGE